MAKAFPTDNPFLRGYYGPVNTEADAGHLQITGEMPKELLGTLYRNGPNPQFAPRGPVPLVRRRRHDPRLPHRERQRLLQEPLGAHAQMGDREQGGRRPLRHLRQSALHRSAGDGAQLDHRQHQHRLARRQASGARGGACPLRARSGEPDAERLRDVRRQALRSLHRPSQDGPQDRRDGVLRLLGERSLHQGGEHSDRDGGRQGDARRDPRRPLPQHDPRLRRDEELDRGADLPAHLLDGTRHGRQAAVRLGARQGHAHRLHSAQRHASPTSSG